MRQALLLAALLILASPSRAQRALYPVGLDDVIDGSALVVEGRVVSQEAFRSAAGIMTANTVVVYRHFDGPEVDKVVVVTPGGLLGHEAMVVEPSLRLSPGAVGVFFLEEDPRTPNAWRTYAGVQGFARYDELIGRAIRVFDSYIDIESDLHEPIETRAGKTAHLHEVYELPRPFAKTGSVVPVISGLSPTTITAGTLSELTITGSGFEAAGSNSLVGFRNADEGGDVYTVAPASNIVSWSTTQIRVLVPSAAGSGDILVQANSGQQGVSAATLTIPYAQINLPGPIEPDLRDANGTGGYSFAYSTNTASGGVNFATSDAVAPFERALRTWQVGTGLNMQTNGGTTSVNTVDPQDGTDVVLFDNNADPLPAGTLGIATSGYASCNGTNWWLAGVDVQFRRDGTDGTNWNFGTGNPAFSEFDFESVAVHELGHGHQLGHVIDDTSVMHYVLTNGDQLRTLKATGEIDGGFFVLNHSEQLNACGQSGMSPLVFTSVEPVFPGRTDLIDAYPNPFGNTLTLDSPAGAHVRIFDTLGRQVLDAREADGLSVNTSAWAAGVYLMVVESHGKRSAIPLSRVGR